MSKADTTRVGHFATTTRKLILLCIAGVAVSLIGRAVFGPSVLFEIVYAMFLAPMLIFVPLHVLALIFELGRKLALLGGLVIVPIAGSNCFLA